MLKKIILLLYFLISTQRVFAGPFNDTFNQVKFRTNFGNCPSRAAGSLVLNLVKDFEKTKSLRSLKKKIVKNELDKKHFLSYYAIAYDPLNGLLSFSFDCPQPLMKVQLYKKNGGIYEAILVDNGQLYDPIYETLMRSEKKLDHDLAYLAIPVGEMDEKAQLKIKDLILSVDKLFRKKISEVILAENGDLTIIMSILNHPLSVFIGNQQWEQKMKKLKRLVKYVEIRQKVPAIINIINLEKVVVKFNNKS